MVHAYSDTVPVMTGVVSSHEPPKNTQRCSMAAANAFRNGKLTLPDAENGRDWHPGIGTPMEFWVTTASRPGTQPTARTPPHPGVKSGKASGHCHAPVAEPIAIARPPVSERYQTTTGTSLTAGASDEPGKSTVV